MHSKLIAGKPQLIKIQYRNGLLLGCFGLCCIVLLAGAVEGFQLERVIQAVQQRYGGNAVSVAKEWNEVLNLFQGETEQKKLKDINDFFNRKIHFATDWQVWGVEDYWTTPIEVMMKGAGDCEDYAIAKYFSLKFIGVSVSKLRLTYVKARIGGPDSNITQAHMVLAYYPTPDAEPLVLDNLISEIRPASRRTDLTPIFSFNSEGVWAAGSSTPQPGGGSRLSKWNDVVEKMKSEGFE
jgi:predicted transglutaminase-like cysteine proteinase